MLAMAYRRTAKASENAAHDRPVSGPGRASSQAALPLFSCGQTMQGRACWLPCCCSAQVITVPHSISLCSVTVMWVLPVMEPFPAAITGCVCTSSSSWPRHATHCWASVCSRFQAALGSLPLRQPDDQQPPPSRVVRVFAEGFLASCDVCELGQTPVQKAGTVVPQLQQRLLG